jgi:hypothetical protein
VENAHLFRSRFCFNLYFSGLHTPLTQMNTLETPHATVHHHSDFTAIEITLKHPNEPLDIMDIKEIYAAFFLQHLQGRLEEMRKMRPDDLIKLGYHVGEKYP